MKKFHIEQNYTEHGTNYYEVEANTLKEAIKKVEDCQCEVINQKCYDYEYDFEGSAEIKEGK